MSVVPQDISIDSQLALKLVVDQFKSRSFNPQKCTVLGEGWDNFVVLINDKFVFRFPRRKIAIPLLEREKSFLLKLQDEGLGLPIPKPQFMGEASQAFPAPFYGHKILRGLEGCQTKLTEAQFEKAAAWLGAFLKKLHGIDYQKWNLKPADLKPLYDRGKVEVMGAFLWERFSGVEKKYDLRKYKKYFEEVLEKAQQFRNKNPLRKRPRCFVHGDLYHRHLLFDEAKNFELAAVIDWGDAGVSDPIVDVSVVYQFFPAKAQGTFEKAYGALSVGEIDYVKFLALYYHLALLWYGDDRSDLALVNHSLKKIKEYPL